MFVEPVKPTFEQKRDETKPTLHLAAAESPFSPQKGKFYQILALEAFVGAESGLEHSANSVKTSFLYIMTCSRAT